MRLFLVVQNEGKQKGMKIPASVLPFFIGRDPECHLRPASPIISKKHCGFSLEGSQFFLEDFGSTNGTIFRGEKLVGKSPIASGDRVVVGPLEFDVLIEAAVTSPAPASPTPTPAPKPVAQSAAPAPKPAPAPAPKAAPAPASATPAPVKQPTPIAPAAKAAPVPVATTPAAKPPAPVAPKPAPAPAPDPAGASNAFDDDIAALLLGGDGMGSGEQLAADGTTVIDLMNTDTNPTPPTGTPIGGGEANKPANSKAPNNTTTDAAKALLEKYMRRPRAT